IEPASRRRPATSRSTAPSTAGDSSSRRLLKRVGVSILLIAAIAAAVTAGFMLGGSGTAPVVKDNVNDQIEGLRGFVQDHS
ncbi:MAG: hypothetical protein WAP37_00420, partial [Solirubrobacterales bacterium]